MFFNKSVSVICDVFQEANMFLRRPLVLSLCVIFLLTLVAADSEGSILLNSKGWQITGPSVTNEFSASIIDDDNGNPDVLLIEIVKNFKADWEFGFGPSIILNFNQVADDASTAKKIIINDESISNNTDKDWYDFHWVLGTFNVASFDQVETSKMDTDLFAQHSWNTWLDDPSDPTTRKEELALFDGVVPMGDAFYPGYKNGGIVIDIDLPVGDGDNAFFYLKEYPSVPEPATMSLLAIGGIAMLVRRKNRK